MPTQPLLLHLTRRGASTPTRAFACAIAVGVLALSAKASIPFWPVPITLQTAAVMLVAMAFGPRWAIVTMLAYLALGALGLPVFAGSSAGWAYMTGTTGGYLVGFLLAAAVLGALAERGWDRTILRITAAMILGHVLVLAPGVSWLAHSIGWERAINGGLLPFWPGTLMKVLVGVVLLRLAWLIVEGLDEPSPPTT